MDTNGTTTKLAPAVDIYEGPDDLLVFAELPGVKVEDLDVRIEKDTLHIEARRDAAEPEGVVERSFHPAGFARSFRLPPGLAGERVEAELADGVLRLRLPKSESAKPRKIAVKTH